MERRVRPPLLYLLCCLLGAGAMQEITEEPRTPAAVPFSLPDSTVPLGIKGSAATFDLNNSTLTLENGSSVPSGSLHPVEPSNSFTEEPALARPTSETPSLIEGPVSLAHDPGRPTSTMKPDGNAHDDDVATIDHSLPWSNQSTEYHGGGTSNTAALESSTASSTTLIEMKRMTVTLGSTQEKATAFHTLEPTLGSSTSTAHSSAAEDYRSSVASTALHPTRTPAVRMETSKNAVSLTLAAAAASTQQEKPAVLDVGDSDTGIRGHTRVITDPLMVAVISVSVIMLGILILVGFLRYKRRHNQTEFRRLQDLPMDDIMEDTPLSAYSY